MPSDGASKYLKRWKGFLQSEHLFSESYRHNRLKSLGIGTFLFSEIPDIERPVSKSRSNQPFKLGHIAEELFTQYIQQCNKYDLIAQNIQIFDELKRTIGEFDFFVKNKSGEAYTDHVELAYKVYLCDPEIKPKQFYSWIGPNRRDSLALKFEKLLEQQFPLLKNEDSIRQLTSQGILNEEPIYQKLCLIGKLYVPHVWYGTKIPDGYDFAINSEAVKGYWIRFNEFESRQEQNKHSRFAVISKPDWLMDPIDFDPEKMEPAFMNYEETKKQLIPLMENKKSQMLVEIAPGSDPVCFFVVWW